MKVLSDKELKSEKYDWYGGGGKEINEFIGKVEQDLTMLESQIKVILENEEGYIKGYMGGDIIKQFIQFLKKEDSKKYLDKNMDFPRKIKCLNKIRNFCAHGDFCINCKTGKEVALIKSKRDNLDEGLLVDDDLVIEKEKLVNDCEVFISNLQIELGYFDDEFEL